MSESAEITIVVADPDGLHLRTGREVVQRAAGFACDLRATNLSRPSPEVDLKSIVQILQLQARCGHHLRIRACGVDAQAAVAALDALLASPHDNSHLSAPSSTHTS